MKDEHIEKVSWEEAAEDIKKINQDFADVLKRIVQHKRGRTPKLFIANYQFGQLIIDKGRFLPPCGSGKCAACEEVSRQAGYIQIPLTLVLEGTVEIFVEEGLEGPAIGVNPDRYENCRTIPLRILGRGGKNEPFGTFEVVDYLDRREPSPASWSVSSGARSLLILSPLGDVGRLRRKIKAISNLPEPTLKSFKYPYNHYNFISRLTKSSNWKTRLLILPKDWITETDPQFRDLIRKLAWQQSQNLRNSSSDLYSFRKHFKNCSAGTSLDTYGEIHVFETMVHLIAVARGDMPAFRPVTSETIQAGPFIEFQKMLLESDFPKSHFPAVFQPFHMDEPGSAGYYSFRRPSLFAPVSEGEIDVKVRSFIQFTKTLHDLFSSLVAIQPSLLKNIDLLGLQYFCSQVDKKESPVKSYKDLPSAEFIPDTFKKQPIDFQIHGEKFFTACIRIVRK